MKSKQKTSKNDPNWNKLFKWQKIKQCNSSNVSMKIKRNNY